jgi:hypothetical protein
MPAPKKAVPLTSATPQQHELTLEDTAAMCGRIEAQLRAHRSVHEMIIAIGAAYDLAEHGGGEPDYIGVFKGLAVVMQHMSEDDGDILSDLQYWQERARAGEGRCQVSARILEFTRNGRRGRLRIAMPIESPAVDRLFTLLDKLQQLQRHNPIALRVIEKRLMTY